MVGHRCDKMNHMSGWKIIGKILALICGRLQRFGADVPKKEFKRLRTNRHTLFYKESNVLSRQDGPQLRSGTCEAASQTWCRD
jgi:hypothetical protein